MTLRLPYGAGQVEVDPGPFELRTLAPRPPAATTDGDPLLHALDRPLGTPRIEAMVAPGDRVLLVISDATRATAAHRVVPALLERLQEAGVKDRHISYAVACGLHLPPDDAVAAGLIGAAAARIRRTAAGADRAEDFADLGTTRRGTPIRLHRALLEADRVILTGAIGFHYYAGFTGGRKSILPGLAAPETIAANHLLALSAQGGREPAAAAGRMDDNPVHLDMAEACARIDPAFLVNVILGAAGRLESAVAGHWDRAHRRGCEDLRRRRAVQAGEPADLVLVSAGGHPHDIDLIQSHKAMEAARALVRPGGAMIVLGACPRGVGHPRLAAWLDGRDAATLALALRETYEVYGQTAMALRQKAESMPIWLVSELDPQTVRRAGLRPAADPGVALQEAAAYLGGGGRGWVMPHGAADLPLVAAGGLSVDSDPESPVR